MSTQPSRRAARHVPAAIVAGAAALALSACGADPAPAPPLPPPAPSVPAVPTVPRDPTTPDTPSEQTVAWTDSVCGALVPVAENLANPPEFDLTAPAATQQSYLAYLTQAQQAADRALERVTAAGPVPVDDGSQVTEEVRNDLTELRDDLQDARTQLEQADPADPSARVNSPGSRRGS